MRIILPFRCAALFGLLAVATVAGFGPPAALGFDEPTSTPVSRSADLPSMTLGPSVAAETLNYMIQSGDVLIFNLPPSFGPLRIDRYRIRSAPALSWLYERAYFWRTLQKDIGEHHIVFDGLAGGLIVQEVHVVVDVR
jgi:hypothetical protein